MIDCVSYVTAVDRIQQELVSTQRFVDGIVFAFNSSSLLFPLIHSILPGLQPGLIGFIRLQVLYYLKS